MNSTTLRKKYIDFFKQNGHVEIPSTTLIPKDDPTTLFTSAGMQPLTAYLLGRPHPMGKRLVNSQRCFRSSDIEEVGNSRHTTFFEMLGNWSLGDYFKKEQIPYFFEFSTKQLQLDPGKFYISVFEGYQDIPKDEETANFWKDLGVAEDRIYYYGVDKNWWSKAGTPDEMPEGEIGGPDSEVFFDFGLEHNPKFGDKCHLNCQCGRFLEIGNSVFIQYRKTKIGLQELPQKNVDFGGGLERLLAAVNNTPDIFQTDLFLPIINAIENSTKNNYSDSHNQPPIRVIADHLKAATFLIIDGVIPSNKLQGYLLRRLLRRAAVKIFQLKSEPVQINDFLPVIDAVLTIYDGVQSVDKSKHQPVVAQIVTDEIERFSKALAEGIKAVQKIDTVSGKTAFNLYQSYGFPFEILKELFAEKGQEIDQRQFEEEFKKHQQLSRATSTF